MTIPTACFITITPCLIHPLMQSSSMTSHSTGPLTALWYANWAFSGPSYLISTGAVIRHASSCSTFLPPTVHILHMYTHIPHASFIYIFMYTCMSLILLDTNIYIHVHIYTYVYRMLRILEYWLVPFVISQFMLDWQ